MRSDHHMVAPLVGMFEAVKNLVGTRLAGQALARHGTKRNGQAEQNA